MLFKTRSVGGTERKDRIETEATDGSKKELGETQMNQVVSPLASLSFRETCAYCGQDRCNAGCTIPDSEEVGAFCSQGCAGRRFRILPGERSLTQAGH